MSRTLFGNSEIKFFNTNPIAFKQQAIMMEKLQSLPNYVETEIFHHWEESGNTVSWHFTFDVSKADSQWENTVRGVIKQYEQPIWDV